MLRSYELSDRFPANASPIKLLKYSPDGAKIATGDVRRVVKVFENGHIIFERRYRSLWDRLRALDHLRALAFDAHGQTLVIASGNRVSGVRLGSQEEYAISSRKPHLGFMITIPQAIAISPADDIAIAHDDTAIEIMRLNGGKPKCKSLWKDNDCPTFLAYLHDGERIVGTDRYSTCVWDPNLGTKLAKMNVDHVYALAASPVDPVIALRHLRSVALWNIDTGNLIAEIAVRPGLPSVAFSRDGQLFAVGDALGVSVFDRGGVERMRHDTGDRRVLSLDFSPVADVLAVGGSDGVITFLEVSKALAGGR